jgi:hypothetical protein
LNIIDAYENLYNTQHLTNLRTMLYLTNNAAVRRSERLPTYSFESCTSRIIIRKNNSKDGTLIIENLNDSQLTNQLIFMVPK